MRLRLLVPRRGRGRGFRRLAAGAAVLAVVAFLIGRATAPERAPRATAPPTPTPTPTPTAVPIGDGELAIGMTEENPAFLAGSPNQEFDRWHDELARMRPTYFRLVVDWAKSVRPDGSFDPAAPQGGCLRTLPPCAGWFGVRGQLEAIAAAQEANPGRYRVMAVVFDTPAQHAAPATACEPAGTEPRSRPPRDLAAYRDLVAGVLAEAERAGVDIEYWAPWNEPNHAYFLAACDPARAYLRLVDATRTVIPRDRLVLGELGGWDAGVFARLPRALVCGAAAFGQHDYDGGEDPLPPLTKALLRLHCPRTPPIWITETGGRRDRMTAAQACRADHRNLVRWYRDPHVTAAFHYTLREDDQYPTGLVTTDLTAAFPALAEWQAWGARPDTASQPPRSRC